MFKIQTLNKISGYGLKEFPKELYQLNEEINDADVILLRSHNLINQPISSSVRAIGRAGAGVNNIPIETCTSRGIAVFNTPGANANAVNELVVAGMLLASRNIYSAILYVKELAADPEMLEKEIESNKKRFAGFELFGKTLGVIGLGSVGVRVANTALNLGMQVVGYDPTISVNRAWELSANAKQARNLEDLFSQSDFISIHVPLTPETKNLINAKRLQSAKTGVTILNFSRAAIVNNDDILTALNDKKALMYISDFPSQELKNHPQVISLPHLGASTKEAEDNCALMIVQQIRNFLEVGSITNSVNFPNVDVSPLLEGTRLIISNDNIPNMVAQISTVLGEQSLNITNLLNKSRNDIAYTLVDVDQAIPDSILLELKNINGVISLRTISGK